MSKHYHDPYRSHAARPASEDPVPPQELVQPQASPVLEAQTGVPTVEAVEESAPAQAVVEEPVPVEEPAPVEEPVLEQRAVLIPPPQVGPGSSADAWRVYAAEATGSPAETWAETSRAAIIEVLRDQGIAVDQSGIQNS